MTFILPRGILIGPVMPNQVNYVGNKLVFQTIQPQSFTATEPTAAPTVVHTIPSNKPFAVGATFTSFENLNKVLEAYQEKNNVLFWMRDSRTLESAAKRSGKRVQAANKALKYFEIRYCCVHGGQRFRSRGEGLRIVRTLKQDCPAHIGLRLSDDCQTLQVNSFDGNHNHEISSLLFKHLPKRRRISEEVKQHAADLLKMGVNKTLLQQQLSAQTGSVILHKDLVNISSKKKPPATRNNFEIAAQRLSECHKAVVEVSVDDVNNLQGLMFQDKMMMDSFKAYPHFIYLDVINDILEIKFPIHVIAVEDGNGKTEIVAVAILDPDDDDSLPWFLDKFKMLNSEWTSVRSCMNVRNLKEKKDLEAAFPSAKRLLCATNTLRTFKKEICTQKMDVGEGQRNVLLDLVKKMLSATTQQEYNVLAKDFTRVAPPHPKSYFLKNWHSVPEEWIPGISMVKGNYVSRTKFRLESLNNRLKSVIGQQSTLEDFSELFFCVLKSLRSERDHEAANVALKVIPRKYDEKSALARYSKYLTPYAFSFVWQQLEAVAELAAGDENHSTTADSCECGFHQGWMLPCQHILTERSVQGQDLYSEDLCHVRWSAAYYFKTQRVFGEVQQTDKVKRSYVSKLRKRPVVPQELKNTLLVVSDKDEATSLANELANAVTDATGAEYENRMEILRTLLMHWRSGKELMISFSEKVNVDNEITVVSSECDVEPHGEEIVQDEPEISLASVTVSSKD